MISDLMQKALNEQIALEGKASFLYLAMASWCDREGLLGCAAFLHRQSEEERMHMLKIYTYLSEVDGYAITPAIPQAPSEWPSVQQLFREVYEHEQMVTQSIHRLTAMATAEDDFTTHVFLQWYIEEQREEEDLMRTILDKIKLIGEGPQSLYYIDNELQAINAAALKVQGEEGA